jgi:hypothetical protein
MKLGKKELGIINTELIVLPRGNSEDIVLKMQAVQSFDMFEQLVKEPEPPHVTMNDGTQTRDFMDEEFLEKVEAFNEKRVNYMIIVGLQATKDLTWDKVKLEKPDTWILWREEMKEAGFTAVEIKYVEQGMAKANSLDSDYIEEARLRFLQEEAKRQEQGS